VTCPDCNRRLSKSPADRWVFGVAGRWVTHTSAVTKTSRFYIAIPFALYIVTMCKSARAFSVRVACSRTSVAAGACATTLLLSASTRLSCPGPSNIYAALCHTVSHSISSDKKSVPNTSKGAGPLAEYLNTMSHLQLQLALSLLGTSIVGSVGVANAELERLNLPDIAIIAEIKKPTLILMPHHLAARSL
jgi:hypothetical protein